MTDCAFPSFPLLLRLLPREFWERFVGPSGGLGVVGEWFRWPESERILFFTIYGTFHVSLGVGSKIADFQKLLSLVPRYAGSVMKTGRNLRT